MKIVATVKKSVQIGPDDWTVSGISHVFDQSVTVFDIWMWADRVAKGTMFGEIIFSNLDGETPAP